jgi:hypothetical protein
MRWSEQITLIALTDPPDPVNEHGFDAPKLETAATVFANKKAVGYAEFYKASMAGITAEMKFDVRAADYEGQTVAEFPPAGGKRYRIFRTYAHPDGEFIELTLSDMPEAQKAREGGGGNGAI